MLLIENTCCFMGRRMSWHELSTCTHALHWSALFDTCSSTMALHTSQDAVGSNALFLWTGFKMASDVYSYAKLLPVIDFFLQASAGTAPEACCHTRHHRLCFCVQQPLVLQGPPPGRMPLAAAPSGFNPQAAPFRPSAGPPRQSGAHRRQGRPQHAPHQVPFQQSSQAPYQAPIHGPTGLGPQAMVHFLPQMHVCVDPYALTSVQRPAAPSCHVVGLCRWGFASLRLNCRHRYCSPRYYAAPALQVCSLANVSMFVCASPC